MSVLYRVHTRTHIHSQIPLIIIGLIKVVRLLVTKTVYCECTLFHCVYLRIEGHNELVPIRFSDDDLFIEFRVNRL